MFAGRRRSGAVLERLTDALGRPVALSKESWDHMVAQHPEMRPHRRAVVETVEYSGIRTSNREDERVEIHWREGAGPSRWLRVAVKYVPGDQGYITSARGDRRGPRGEQL